MKNLFPIALFAGLAVMGSVCCGAYRTAKGLNLAAEVASESAPVSHEIWDGLLKKYVNSAGLVNYKGMLADSSELKKYTDLLSKGHPNEKNWSRNEQMAYWINAYNAFTVQLVLRNYPLKGIKEIGGKFPFVNSTWDIKFISIEGKKYDLNNIEHNILRPKFKDPRIHFAINCASKSCAKLRNSAFTAKGLDAQLDEAARQFLNDPKKNAITAEKAQLSMYFKWFEDDFKGAAPSVWEYVNKFSKTKMTAQTSIDFLDYNWSLNEQ